MPTREPTLDELLRGLEAEHARQSGLQAPFAPTNFNRTPLQSLAFNVDQLGRGAGQFLDNPRNAAEDLSQAIRFFTATRPGGEEELARRASAQEKALRVFNPVAKLAGVDLLAEPAPTNAAPATSLEELQRRFSEAFTPPPAQGTEVGRLPRLPAFPTSSAPAPTDFAPIEAAIEALRPSAPNEQQLGRLRRNNIFQGLAQATASLPPDAGVGDVILAAGSGLLSGRAAGERAVFDAEAEHRAALADFNRLVLDGELGKAEIRRREAEDAADRAFQEKKAKFELELADIDRRSPQFLGMAPGGGVVVQTTEDDGRVMLHVERPSSMLSGINTVRGLAAGQGAGQKGQALAVPTIPNSLLGTPIFLLSNLNEAQVAQIFGEDMLQDARDFAIEQSQTQIATGNDEAAGRIATDAFFGFLASAMVQSPELQRLVLENIVGGQPAR